MAVKVILPKETFKNQAQIDIMLLVFLIKIIQKQEDALLA